MLSPLVVAVLTLVVGHVTCQVQNDCQVTRSQTMLGFMDIRCQCMEALQMNIQNVNMLTFDRSDCQELTILDIIWQNLDQGIGPRAVTFIGAQIVLAAPSRQAWDSKILKIEFQRCLFNEIPSKAFGGLTRLSELRFINTYIAKIDSYGISNLGNLTTIEIADSDVDEIAANAISGLPNIFELGLVRSNIKMMRKGAIHNLRLPQLPVDQTCPNIDIRFGSERDANAIGDIMGRRLESTENLPLPEFGARLLIYRSNFTTFESEAVESDLFAFVILGGNQVSYLGSSAFKVELSNQCEISALMIVANVFESVQPGALAFLNGKPEATHKTFFVLTNNTFEYVAEGGFALHPSMEIYTVQDNKFVCNCMFFEWIMGKPATTRQQEVERELIMDGKCADQNLGIVNFTDTCTESDFSTSFPWTSKDPIIVTLPENVTAMAMPGSSPIPESSSASVGSVNWFIGLVGLAFVRCLL